MATESVIVVMSVWRLGLVGVVPASYCSLLISDDSRVVPRTTWHSQSADNYVFIQWSMVENVPSVDEAANAAA